MQGLAGKVRPVAMTNKLQPVLDIWSEVLELDVADLAVDTHILLQGGDSLQVSRILSRVRQVLGVDLNVADIAEFATPRKMATCCEYKTIAEEVVAAPPADLVVPGKRWSSSSNNRDQTLLPEFPATGMQQGLWFAEQLSGNSNLYAMAISLHLQGELDQQALAFSVQWLLASTPLLNASFTLKPGARVLTVNYSENLVLTNSCESDASALPMQLVTEASLPVIQAQILDLKQTLFRFELLQLSATHYCLCLCCHHGICDGWSGALLLRKLSYAYGYLLEHQCLPDIAPDLEFQCYALQEAQCLQNTNFTDERLHWWRNTLSGAVDTNPWFWTQSVTDVWPHQLQIVNFELDAELVSSCKQFAARHELSIFTQMLASWLLALQSVSGMPEQVLVIPVADRQPHQETSIGCFTRLLLLRSKASQNPDLLAHAKAVAINFEHAQANWLPFNWLAAALKPALLPDGNPWTSHLFAFQNFPAAPLELHGMSVRVEQIMPNLGQYALKCEVLPTSTAWMLRLEYARELPGSSQLALLFQTFESNLRLLLQH